MNLGEIIKSLRSERGLTQQALGEAVGVSALSVRSWERNAKKPSLDALVSLSELFHVSIDAMVGVSGVSEIVRPELFLNAAERQLVINYRKLDSYGKRAVQSLCSIETERVSADSEKLGAKNSEHPSGSTRYIPRYATPSAAGIAIPIDGSDFEMIGVNKDVPDNADYAVGIQGSSMYPYINDGDTVYVEKDAELAIGDVGIFCVDGSMYCKIYYKRPDGTLVLASANPELKHTNVVVSQDSGMSVRSCGKVIMAPIKIPDYLSEEEDGAR